MELIEVSSVKRTVRAEIRSDTPAIVEREGDMIMRIIWLDTDAMRRLGNQCLEVAGMSKLPNSGDM